MTEASESHSVAQLTTRWRPGLPRSTARCWEENPRFVRPMREGGSVRLCALGALGWRARGGLEGGKTPSSPPPESAKNLQNPRQMRPKPPPGSHAPAVLQRAFALAVHGWRAVDGAAIGGNGPSEGSPGRQILLAEGNRWPKAHGIPQHDQRRRPSRARGCCRPRQGREPNSR